VHTAFGTSRIAPVIDATTTLDPPGVHRDTRAGRRHIRPAGFPTQTKQP
jgi:hypothetical protein